MDFASCGRRLDHGVLVVGYGNDGNTHSGSSEYYKVTNSWGSSRGEEG
jgi:C1A family cysteine protease